MSRTTDPRQAIQDLLDSSDHDTVIQYDGTAYRVATSRDKREGFYEILTRGQACYKVTSRPRRADDLTNPKKWTRAAKWLAENAETWLRSARYNESLAATASDQEHPTGR